MADVEQSRQVVEKFLELKMATENIREQLEQNLRDGLKDAIELKSPATTLNTTYEEIKTRVQIATQESQTEALEQKAGMSAPQQQTN